MIARIRKGNDFKHVWPITWNGQPEDFSDATDITLTATVYGQVKTLTEGVDYHIDGGTVVVDFTPVICDITGTYTVELNYIKPSAEFIDGDRRSAVDVKAFQIVNTSAEANATEGVSLSSEALAIYALKYEDLSPENIAELQRPATEAAESIGELEQTIEGNEATRQSNESDRQIAEGLRQTNTLTAIQNANTAADNANEMSSHPPVIIDDYWHNWNFTTNQYETTGQYARGDSAIEGSLVLQTTGQSAVDVMSQKAVTDEIAQLAGDVEQLAYVKIKNEAVNGNFENGLIAPFSKTDGQGGTSTLAINSSTPISGNYDIRLTIITPSTGGKPDLRGMNKAANIGDKIYLHFYAKILSGIPIIESIYDGDGLSSIYGGDVINGRNTRIIDVAGTSANLGRIYFSSPSVWDMQMDNFIRINLTESFGAGNEPTEEEMNLLLDMLPVDYFEGEITIPAQKIMQWQLAGELALKNAVTDEIAQLSDSVSQLSDSVDEQFNWFTESGYVDVEGEFRTSNNYMRTDYIPLGDWLLYSTTVRLQVSHVAFFNEDKVFISAIPGSGTNDLEQKTERLTSADYPEGAAYFIASMGVNYAAILKFNISYVINSKSSDTASQFGSEKFFSNVIPENKIIYASHFAGILRASPVLLPEMSIWSLQAANRAGFKYVQCNAALTSDGYRIMQHDIAMNRTMTDAYGNALTEETLSTDLTLEYIKSNFRYKSTNPRFRTEVLEMTEFLNLCTEYGIVPIFNNTSFSESELDTISGIVGDAFGIFQIKRSFDRKDCRYIVYAWRGNTIDTPEEAVTLMEKIGKPAIYGAYATVFTKELSVALRKAGYLCAPASVYFEDHWPNVKQFADFNVTDIYCPPFEGGDVIISSDLGWDDFTTDGTEENGLIILEAGQTLSYESDESYYLGKTVLDVNYLGELKIKCCSMNPTNKSSYTYERNASSPLLQVTPSIVNDKATLVLTATKRTLINYVNFRIKRI